MVEKAPWNRGALHISCIREGGCGWERSPVGQFFFVVLRLTHRLKRRNRVVFEGQAPPTRLHGRRSNHTATQAAAAAAACENPPTMRELIDLTATPAIPLFLSHHTTPSVSCTRINQGTQTGSSSST
ncbi:unnamed protein product, partial [Ectocarpus sp. 12 AP-2014]